MIDSSATHFFADVVSIGFSVIDPITTCDGQVGLFGSSFHAVTAAFATLGYYAQAEMLAYMAGGFDKFATIVYLLSGVTGIVMMAFGQPPKNWVYFFIGPAIYHFLVVTPTEARGVAWMIGPYVQPQRQVWRLAEAGVRNSGWARRIDDFQYDIEAGPAESVRMSMPFVVFDAFVSDTVRNIAMWAGSLSSLSSDVGSELSNVALEYPRHDSAGHRFGRGGEIVEACGEVTNHAAFSDLKWKLLNSITSAELTNTEARDSLARFVSNECGDELMKSIDFGRMATAVHQNGDYLPSSIIENEVGGINTANYSLLKSHLARQYVPVPQSLRNLMMQGREGAGFLNSMSCNDNFRRVMSQILNNDKIRCDSFLYTLILYFRYEATMIYIHTFQNAITEGQSPYDAVYTMLYGWDLPFHITANAEVDGGLSLMQQEQFVNNLILAHLFRNELNRLPELMSVPTDNSTEVIENSQLFNSSVGSQSKFAEVYTWALMIPYIQGILLFLLTMTYPIVCMLILNPNWSKMIITWMTFFIWAKLWDVGFAVVTNIDKSLWSMMASDKTSAVANGRVLEMAHYGGFTWTDCAGFTASGICIEPEFMLTQNISSETTFGSGTCLDVLGTATGSGAFGDPGTFLNTAYSGASAFDDNLRLFDLSVLLGGALDFDVANGYYIYILAALYFAVPAVTGQLVLGAKAGAASFVDKMAGDPAGKSASAAQQAFTGNETSRIKQNVAAVGQESHAKGYRQSGLAAQAFDQQNQSAHYGMMQAQAGEARSGYERLRNAAALNSQAEQSRLGAFSEGVKHLAAASQHSPGLVDQNQRRNNQVERNNNGGLIGDNSTGDPTAGDQTQGKKEGIQGQPNPNASQGVGTNGQTDENGRSVTDPGSFQRTDKGNNLQVGDKWKGMKVGRFLEDGRLGNMVGIATSVGNSERAILGYSEDNNYTALGGVESINGFQYGQYSSGYRSAADRTSAQANFAAATSNFQAMTSFADSRGGRMGALGLQNIGMDSLPTDMVGLSGLGQTNTYDQEGRTRSDTRGMVNFFDPNHGVFGRNVNNATAGLHQSFGYQPVTTKFTPVSYTEAGSNAITNAGKVVTELGGFLDGPENN